MNLLAYFFTGMPGPMELLIIALVVLLLFGNRLPTAMRSLGKSVVEFKRGVQGVEDEISGAMNQADEEAKKKDTAQPKDEEANV